MAEQSSKSWKLFGGLSAIFAGIVTRKVLVKTWRGVTGNDPPANPAAPGTKWPEAVAFAVVSGAAMGLGRMLGTRKAAGYYKKSTGHLPPGMEEVT